MHVLSTPLPTPNVKDLRRCEQLTALIIDAIHQAGGAIGFDEFMHYALYAPQLGYYQAPNTKFGLHGDFVTAPELSSDFGRCVTNAILPLLSNIPGACILEIGAGSGALAEQILRHISHNKNHSTHYSIVETSAYLRSVQHQRLSQAMPAGVDRIHWLEQQTVRSFNGVVIVNEVLDALPVKRFTVAEEQFYEVQVSATTEGQLIWSNALPDSELSLELHAYLHDMVNKNTSHYASEINTTSLEEWLNALYLQLGQAIVMLFDYGCGKEEYYHASRYSGSLRCYYQHRQHNDPFYYPGLQDITADVDFTRVAKLAEKIGFTVVTYTTLAQFLLANALLTSEQATINNYELYRHRQAIHTLSMPYEMGERVKLMVLAKNLHYSWENFTLRDYQTRL